MSYHAQTWAEAAPVAKVFERAVLTLLAGHKAFSEMDDAPAASSPAHRGP